MAKEIEVRTRSSSLKVELNSYAYWNYLTDVHALRCKYVYNELFPYSALLILYSRLGTYVSGHVVGRRRIRVIGWRIQSLRT